MKRASVTLALIATSATVIGHHHHTKHSTAAPSAALLAEPAPPRVSRWLERKPLPVPRSRQHRQRPHPTVVGSGTYADVTEYCATGNRNAAGVWPQFGDVAVMDRSIPFGARVTIAGNVYTVRDWIGSGSDFDIYGGDVGCEQRAVNFGRRHLRVVLER